MNTEELVTIKTTPNPNYNNTNKEVNIPVSATKTYNFLDYATSDPYKRYGEKIETKVNKSINPDFVQICKFHKKSLKAYLSGRMKAIYKENCHIGDGYIYCKGDIPVLLTAHMDTVHKELVHTYYEYTYKWDMKDKEHHIITSPQGIGGDDRCGDYMILKVLEAGYRPSVLFCEEEEVGGIGSDKFTKTKYIDELSELKFLLELDRKGDNDAVFYEDGNETWHEWLLKETNLKENWGTFSDICNLSPACGVSSVNLSCGYYNQHTTSEYVVLEEMERIVEIVKNLLDTAKEDSTPHFEFEETWGYCGHGYNDYDYSYPSYPLKHEYNTYTDWYTDTHTVADRKQVTLEVDWMDYTDSEEGAENYTVIKGTSVTDCWGQFFLNFPYACYVDVLDYDLY